MSLDISGQAGKQNISKPLHNYLSATQVNHMSNLIKSIFFAGLAMTLTACDQLSGSSAPTAERIIGKWKLERLDLPKETTAQLEEYERAQLAEKQLQMSTMRYTFFKDGTYSMDMELTADFKKNIERGNFQLMNDGAILVTEPIEKSGKNGGNEETPIHLLANDTLVLGEAQTGAARLVFVRME
jgi:hypothetical protein